MVLGAPGTLDHVLCLLPTQCPARVLVFLRGMSVCCAMAVHVSRAHTCRSPRGLVFAAGGWLRDWNQEVELLGRFQLGNGVLVFMVVLLRDG